MSRTSILTSVAACLLVMAPSVTYSMRGLSRIDERNSQQIPNADADWQDYQNPCKAECATGDVACHEKSCEPLVAYTELQGSNNPPIQCNGPVVRCIRDPCLDEICAAFPNARCEPDYCRACSPRWYLGNLEVSCELHLKSRALKDLGLCAQKGEDCFTDGNAEYTLNPFDPKKCCDGLFCCAITSDESDGIATSGMCLKSCR